MNYQYKVVTCLLLVGFAFTNCGSIPNSSASSAGSESGAVSASDLILGETLYTDNCASCHDSVDSSEVQNSTAASIQAAIDDDRGGMGNLSDMTADEIQAVADALNWYLDSGTSSGGSSSDDSSGSDDDNSNDSGSED